MKTLLAVSTFLLSTISHADWSAQVTPKTLECSGSQVVVNDDNGTFKPADPERTLSVESKGVKASGGKFNVTISYKLDGESHEVKAKKIGATLGAMGNVDFILYAMNGDKSEFMMNSSMLGFSTPVPGEHNAFGWLENCGGLAKHTFEFPAFVSLGQSKDRFLVSCKGTFQPQCKDGIGEFCSRIMGSGAEHSGADCSKNPNN